MASALVGGAFLSASVNVLIDRIIPHEFLDFFQSKKLDISLLQKLKTTLLTLQAVLDDAEEKQITRPAIKKWLDELTHAVFDADDLLDTINYEALRCKVEAESQSQTIRDQVRNFFSSTFKPFSGVINSELQALFQRLEQFAQQIYTLGLEIGFSSRVWHGTPTSSVLHEQAIYGRDDDKKKLKDYLLSEDGSGSEIGVIAIVGMGGLGKTTLARLLYNDHEVREKFNLTAWAYISKDFDPCGVTKTILESVSLKTIETNNLNTLQVELQQSLSNKNFLLVLDDIWDGSYDDWNKLRAIFNAGEMGSKIIITTRDESVAQAMQTFLPILYLTPLPSEDCWSLLAKHAFGRNYCNQHSNLELIGREIGKKCGGVPLAAEAIGGLLRFKLSEKEWNNVLKSNIWDLPNLNVLPALLLSYRNLPAPLKRCFAYCSIFPKNSELDKRMVVQLWIAEGLVYRPKNEKTIEEVGDEYFDELVLRSLISRHLVDEKRNFWMHDLINDLATTVSSAYCIRYEHRKPQESLERVRHLSYNRGWYDYLNKFDSFYGLKGLRTFICLPLQKWWPPRSYISNKVVDELLPTMRQLRVLSLSYYGNITELPSSLENLIHLRYLDLSLTRIKRLPDVTCKLYNLQTLLLSYCKCLTELPKDMQKLVNLRHLDISGTGLKEMPIQITRLQNLQTLSTFVVSKKQNGLKIGELRKFPHLQGKLSISELQNVTDPFDAFQANLKKKEQIEELTLEWESWDQRTSNQDSQIERFVLEQLQPSTNLKQLTIKFYSGTSFPNWLGDSSFCNMVYLCISDCEHCWCLPPLGQLLSLKELNIRRMKSVKTVGTEFYGSSSTSFQPFPSLEILKLEDMSEWEEWNLTGAMATEFPNLRELCLLYCPKLKGNLPRNLPSLRKLYLWNCPLLESQHTDELDYSNTIRPLDLGWMMLGFNFLQHLTIEGIPSLVSFPRDGLPTTLRSLSVFSCKNLEFLPHESLHSYTSLEYLRISSSCLSLESFPLGCLPVLTGLYISGCENLKSISIAKDEYASKSLSFLRTISIWSCPELESFPQGGLPTPNLIDFRVSNCRKLNSLPEQINAITGLQKFSLYGLSKLQSFAEEGLPLNLRELDLCSDRSFPITVITEWGLQRLTCLSRLQIGGDDLVNALMKMKASLLPASLVVLQITGLKDVKCLEGKWLQHLTSLEKLEISWSESLESLPEEGLPSSLLILTIMGCPLLEANCQSNIGKEWEKIAHIPCKIINRKVII